MKRAPGIAAAAARPEISTGTVWSASPWITSVGTLMCARSARKSVSPKARTHATVALGEASMARLPVQAMSSLEDGEENTPTPKKVLAKFARKCGRSVFRPAIIPSKTERSTPSGLSAVFSR